MTAEDRAERAEATLAELWRRLEETERARDRYMVDYMRLRKEYDVQVEQIASLMTERMFEVNQAWPPPGEISEERCGE